MGILIQVQIMENLSDNYSYRSPGPGWSNNYLWEPLKRILFKENPKDRRVFEIGCGNGATANMLHEHGFAVTAIDPSESGIRVATESYPSVTFALRSAYDDLADEYGTFPTVVSLEVVEHCFWPRKYAETIYNLLEPNGLAIISTPYHGYLKNLALAVSGKFDFHFTALWDGGHIKFWSINTLGQLLFEAGFKSVDFVRVGRIGPLAKSMIAVARK
ncbi:MAG: class I SAM-dependent methyltransferase [Lysobacterales bacterium]